MGLNYPGEWKFEGVGFDIPTPAVHEFIDLMVDIADGSKSVIEDFKSAFGQVTFSSSYDWAISDLYTVVERKASNAAFFIDSLWKGINSAKAQGLKVPSNNHVNNILVKYGIPLKIEPPNLVLVNNAAIVDALGSKDDEHEKELVPIYKPEEKIGEGGYGIVYKVTRSTTVSDFEYALKVLDPSPFVDNIDKALQRFQREIKVLQSLQHRSIIQYFEAGITIDNKPYIVMPLIKGDDLKVAASAMNMAGILDMFIEILFALQYAHTYGVIHRDLKPSNIIVRSSDSQPVILDFGCAYILDQLDSQSLTSQGVGTIGYIPSEVLADPKKRSPLQDIYACGIMLYESFANRRPDPANYVPLSTISQEYGVLDNIVEQAIAGESKRLDSAQKFASLLAALRRDIE